MPGMDGMEATQHIRALGTDYAKNMPIIALTANAAIENEKMFLANGFDAFLSKPINVVKLDAVIRARIMRTDSDKSAAAVTPPQDAEPVPESELILKPNNIPGVNMTLGLSLYEDDMEMFVEILRSFAENIPSELDKLPDVSAETLPDYGIDVHTVKGACASIGAKELNLRAKELEAMAKGGDLAGVQERNEEFVKDARVLVGHINEWLANNQ